MSKLIKMSCVAFSGEKRRTYVIEVEEDKTIRVYDPVGGYYTRNHILSARVKASAFAKAYGPKA